MKKQQNFCKKCKTNSIEPCTAGFDKLVVSPDGRVLPCEAFKFLLKLDNKDIRPSIEDYNLEYLYDNDPLMQLLRCKFNLIDIWCQNNCKIFKQCGGGCKGQKLKDNEEFINFLKKEMKIFYNKK